jgi:hypothetical protein
MRCLPPLDEVLTEPDKCRARQLLDGSGKLLQRFIDKLGSGFQFGKLRCGKPEFSIAT